MRIHPVDKLCIFTCVTYTRTRKNAQVVTSLQTSCYTSVHKLSIVAEISLFPVGGGAKPPKFPTKLSNFRHTPPFALEKTVFSPLLGQNFREFVNFP